MILKMENDLFLPILFYGLYPPEEYKKIDLRSGTFYVEVLDLYCKIDNAGRLKLIQGIRYLSNKIQHLDEMIDALSTWESLRASMIVRQAFFMQNPNLVKEFKDEVNDILNSAKEKLLNRIEKELIQSKEKIHSDKIIISSLLKSIDDNPNKDFSKQLEINVDNPTPYEKIAFNNLLSKIKFSKNDEIKMKVEKHLNELNEIEYFKKTNGIKFASIALIFYETGWIANTKTFTEWLSIFSDAFQRKIPKYKPNQLKQAKENIKIKIPFLDCLPNR